MYIFLILGLVLITVPYLIAVRYRGISPLRHHDHLSTIPAHLLIIIAVCMLIPVISSFFIVNLSRSGIIIFPLLFLMCIVALDFVRFLSTSRRAWLLLMLPYLLISTFSLIAFLSLFSAPVWEDTH